MKKSILDLLGKEFLFFDGGTGSVLQAEGLKPGEKPEFWNLTKSEAIIKLHENYFLAGANIVKTNTFGANRLRFGEQTKQIIEKAIQLAKQARLNIETKYNDCNPHFVALDIGPSGKLLQPLGDLSFEDAVSLFSEVAFYGLQEGVDLFLIETMNDCYETKAAVLGVKEAKEKFFSETSCSSVTDIPIFVTNVYDKDGRLLTGSTVTEMTSLLEGLGVDAFGMNCSLGPEQMEKLLPSLIAESSLPIIVNPNAGLPKLVNGKTVYDIDDEKFSSIMKNIASLGATVLGGCCGTNPEYIRKMIYAITKSDEPVKFVKPVVKNFCTVCSGTQTVKIGQSEMFGKNAPVLIGERINPTGKKKLKEALREKNIKYILDEALTQEKNGAQILDVNVGLPEIDETQMMLLVIKEIQSITSLPLQIDTSNIETMEKALRIYNGKALINSLNGKEEVMDKVFPLVKKYGGVVVALTLDEDGIPSNVSGRIKIAEKIYQTATKYGVDKKNIIIDPLAMAVSSDSNAPTAALETVKKINYELGGNTIMGVSNISFGLPKREVITSTFFAMTMENGLSAAIMNPSAVEMKKAWYSFCALRAFDLNCLRYIDFATQLDLLQQVSPVQVKDIPTQVTELEKTSSELEYAIVKGLKNNVVIEVEKLLKSFSAMQIIQDYLIPALDLVGKQYESKKIYLPQLLMSADAATTAFEIIKKQIDKTGEVQKKYGTIILATVQGDIHDIGKNIVKVILENYGYDILDLGKDVAPEIIVDKCIENKIQLVGLSALMTTTVPAMEKTIVLLKEKAPWCKICVGGAVLTQEYSKKIGADYFAKDAMETVKVAKEIFNS